MYQKSDLDGSKTEVATSRTFKFHKKNFFECVIKMKIELMGNQFFKLIKFGSFVNIKEPRIHVELK